MHRTMQDGLMTVTLTYEEWTDLSVGYEKLMRYAKYRVVDGGDGSSFSPSIELCECIVDECDRLLCVDDWCDKTKLVEASDFIECEDNPCK